MIEFIRSGGVAMLVVLIFGLTTLISSVLFARGPDAHKVRFLVAMAFATLFAAINGPAAGVATTFHSMANNAELGHSPELKLILLQGISESLANAILGFTLLTLAAFVTAIGFRRMPRAVA